MEFWKTIEQKWQRNWEAAKIFEANPDSKKPKYFITVAYPYPNSPQHIGHGRTYTLADVHARYMRMRGFNVLLPMAFHYTGTPVLAMSKRLAEKDQDLIDDFVNVYKVPKQKLGELIEPYKMASYFHEEIKTGMKTIGFSIDWRREFTTIDPHYKRFIEWQFQKLRQKGYITRGSHPVGWCPKDGNPVGQHDTTGDVEPEIGEFTLIKFMYNGWILPAATLRPETIFGVTNLWLNPTVEYVRAQVDGEKWIISKDSARKLLYLNRKIKIIKTIRGDFLVGKRVINPVTKKQILILPAVFVDPKNATGVVMSVPGHAPYDYVALENLAKTPAKLKEYGLTPDIVSAVEPISIITVSQYSAIPAGDVVKQMGIVNQQDRKLEDATKEVYRHEFHNGVMKSNTGKYSGLSVAEAKDKVRHDLIIDGKAETMYELLNKPVVCRCGTECVVKIFGDQWFIDYGNPEWKILAHRALEKMEILPEELRSEFNHVIDWLHEKACARKSGMGTKLPWDPEWIIESLSDSVIYMAYYTIARHIKEYGITPSQLIDDVFNYIFLGLGKAKVVADEARIDINVLRLMRREFVYFYPLDSRHSARDLVSNHLAFMIFNHTAIFQQKLWPRQIVTNGFVMMQGVKMSKSFGNILPLIEAIEKFGADPVRLGILATAELLQDADFSSTLAKSMRDRLERFYRFGVKTKSRNTELADDALTLPDRWMLSRLQEHIRMATEFMNKLAVRKAIHSILYELDQDCQWYLRRITRDRESAERREIIAEVFNRVVDAQVRLLAPVTPHICEELWAKRAENGFISLASWPEPDMSKIDIQSEENERLIAKTLEDTLNIIRVTEIVPTRVCYYVAATWKWKVFQKAIEKAIGARGIQGELMKELMKVPDLKKIAKQVSKFVAQTAGDVNKISDSRKEKMLKIGMVNEAEVLKEAEDFFKQELKVNVCIYNEEEPKRYDPAKRARLAQPHRPAIYIE